MSTNHIDDGKAERPALNDLMMQYAGLTTGRLFE